MAHRLAPEVQSDLDQIWLYIARESGSEKRADDQIDAITKRFFCFPNIPTLAVPAMPISAPGTRSFSVGDYVIVYDIDREDVQILCVAYGRRDLIALFAARSISAGGPPE